MATTAGKELRNSGLRFDRIFCSTAVRARQTLECMGLISVEETDAVVYSDCLEELSQGEWEGRPRREIYTPKVISCLNRENPFFRPPGGESQNDVGKRMTDFIKGEILDRYKDGVFLIVGHGVAFKCFIRGVLGSDARMTHKLGMDNLSMTRLTYSDRDGWSLDWMNRPLIPTKAPHLGTKKSESADSSGAPRPTPLPEEGVGGWVDKRRPTWAQKKSESADSSGAPRPTPLPWKGPGDG